MRTCFTHKLSLTIAVLLCHCQKTLIQCASVSSGIVSNEVQKQYIVWNGCESPTTSQVPLTTPLVEKPKICKTRLPEDLETEKPMSSPAPFAAQVKSNSINNTLFLITVSTTRDEHDGKMKSYKVPKGFGFQAVYITSMNPEGEDVGQFIMDPMGTTGRFDIGYCCGKSRYHFNFYELIVKGGDWSAEISWDPMDYVGPVTFKITTVQKMRRYWNLDPVIVIVD